jgi:hypothetical protein
LFFLSPGAGVSTFSIADFDCFRFDGSAFGTDIFGAAIFGVAISNDCASLLSAFRWSFL